MKKKKDYQVKEMGESFTPKIKQCELCLKKKPCLSTFIKKWCWCCDDCWWKEAQKPLNTKPKKKIITKQI